MHMLLPYTPSWQTLTADIPPPPPRPPQAILLAYKKSLSLGLRDRGTVCTLTALGHFYHVRGDHTRANSFYKVRFA